MNMLSQNWLTPQALSLLGFLLFGLLALLALIQVAAPKAQHASPMAIRLVFLFGGLMFISIAMFFLATPFEASRGLPNWVSGALLALVGSCSLLGGLFDTPERLKKAATKIYDSDQAPPIWRHGAPLASRHEQDQHLDRFFKAVEDRENAEK